MCSFIWTILVFLFLSQHSCYVVRGRALGICQGGATQVAGCVVALYVGESPRRNNAAYLALSWLSVTFPLSTSKLGPSGADSQVDGLCTF